MVSNLIGQKKIPSLSLLLRRIIILNYVIILPIVLFTLIFPATILSIFSTDVKIITDGINSLSIITLAILFAVPGEAFYSAIMGTGDTRVILFIQIMVTIITLLCVYITAFILQLNFEYIWLAGWSVCFCHGCGLKAVSGKD